MGTGLLKNYPTALYVCVVKIATVERMINGNAKLEII